ncbi:MAG: iron-sulfur cluster assembly accessory protein [Chitinophagales bacterium]|nr:iron-sulfur cluster assembly accessory protein [Bacteroidota bacterium]MCB9042461.1 iron-sulfur cluster assembly accessory protein [Chitinophagales bacterium]
MSENILSQEKCPISLSANALKEIKHLMYDKDLSPAESALRIGVEGGGCAGFSYILRFDEATDQDDVFAYQGIKLIINRAHLLYIHSMEVDFLSGLDNRGFIFNNPNASSNCGCGSSFSTT